MLNTIADHGVATLPISAPKPGATLELWSVRPTGDYGADCAAGRRVAETVLAEMRATGSPLSLGAVMRAMIERGEYDGIAIGFATVIGLATVGAKIRTSEDSDSIKRRVSVPATAQKAPIRVFI